MAEIVKKEVGYLKKYSTVAQALAYLNKVEGTGIVESLEEDVKIFPHVATDMVEFDRVTGIGGFPQGRITELYGDESTGKTTLALQALAKCQKQGGRGLFLEFEQSYIVAYAKALGVDVSADKLILSQPNTLEQGIRVMRVLIDNGLVDFVLIDSLASAPTEADMAAQPGEDGRLSKPKAVSAMLKQLTKSVADNKVTMVIINQTRLLINSGQKAWGPPRKTTPGGVSLKFLASLRVELSVKELIKDAKAVEVIGIRVGIFVVKNKLAAPFKHASMILYFGRGFDEHVSTVDSAITYGLITIAGGQHFSTPLFEIPSAVRGREKTMEWLRINPEQYKLLFDEVKSYVCGEKTLQNKPAEVLPATAGLPTEEEFKLAEDPALEADTEGPGEVTI